MLSGLNLPSRKPQQQNSIQFLPFQIQTKMNNVWNYNAF